MPTTLEVMQGVDRNIERILEAEAIPMTMTQEHIAYFCNNFDNNLIHSDETYARTTMWGGRIAQGMLSVSQFATHLLRLTDEEIVRLNVTFTAPVRLGDVVRPRLALGEKGLEFLSSVEGSEPRDVIKGSVAIGKRPYINTDSLVATWEFLTRYEKRQLFGPQTRLSEGGYLIDHPKTPDHTMNETVSIDIEPGLRHIEPICFLSGAFGNLYPGTGTVYSSQKGMFFRRNPWMHGIRVNPVTEVFYQAGERKEITIKRDGTPEKVPAMKYTFGTRVWDIGLSPVPTPLTSNLLYSGMGIVVVPER